jgi:hypothetical protein
MQVQHYGCGIATRIAARLIAAADICWAFNCCCHFCRELPMHGLAAVLHLLQHWQQLLLRQLVGCKADTNNLEEPPQLAWCAAAADLLATSACQGHLRADLNV